MSAVKMWSITEDIARSAFRIYLLLVMDLWIADLTILKWMKAVSFLTGKRSVRNLGIINMDTFCLKHSFNLKYNSYTP